MNNGASNAAAAAAMAVAVAAASRAADAEARAIIAGYAANGASVDQMRQYAHAVLRLHPDPVSLSEDRKYRLLWGAVLLVAIAGAIWMPLLRGNDDVFSVMEYRVWGFILAPCAAAIVVGAVAFISYLFGAFSPKKPSSADQ